MTLPAFTLDATALAAASLFELAEIDEDEYPEGWDPVEHGQEGAVLLLVQNAQLRGIIHSPFMAPTTGEIQYSYSDDEDGGGYLWDVSLYHPDRGFLKLASNWQAQRNIVQRGLTGHDAMVAILEEAVLYANLILGELQRWTPQVFHLLAITHNDGEEASLHASEADATDAVYDWVVRYWNDDGPKWPMPDDQDEAIEDYFGHELARESYRVEELAAPRLFAGERAPQP